MNMTQPMFDEEFLLKEKELMQTNFFLCINSQLTDLSLDS